MSGPGRLRLHRQDLPACWEALTCALQRGSARRGGARVVEAHGGLLAELSAGPRFAARLPVGLGVALTGAQVPACRCERGGARRGCLQVHRDPGGGTVLVGDCARVPARALLAVLLAHPRPAFLELADPAVLPRALRSRWTPPAREETPTELAAAAAAQVRDRCRAYLAAPPRRPAARGSGGDRAEFWVGFEHCVDCGRQLTDMVSIERGRGAICEGRHRRGRRRFAAAG